MQWRMLTAHDYLEVAFLDYFGLWTPSTQTFSPAVRQATPAKRDKMFAHCGLLARMLNGNLTGLGDAPLEGVALLWCVLAHQASGASSLHVPTQRQELLRGCAKISCARSKVRACTRSTPNSETISRAVRLQAESGRQRRSTLHQPHAAVAYHAICAAAQHRRPRG